MSMETQTAIKSTATRPIPTADLPATTNIINQSTINNDGNANVNANQSNSNPTSSTSPSKARRRRKRNNKNKNKNQGNSNKANNRQNASADRTKSGSKSNTKSNKKRRHKSSQSQSPKQKQKEATNANPKPSHYKLDRVELLNKSKKNPWSNKQQSSAFENIMSEQAQTQNPVINYSQTQMNDEQLLEQQMIAMAIAASKKEQQEAQLKEYQKYSKAQNDEEKVLEQDKEQEKEQKEEIISTSIANEDEEKQIIEDNPPKASINDELIAAAINAQSNISSNVKMEDSTLSDQALAIQLQQHEQHEYNRRQKMSKIYDGKYAKVTSSATKPTAIPKAALNFYYDDESMLNGGLTKEQYQQHLMTTQASEESIIDENTNTESIGDTQETEVMEEELEAISKHDAKIWSEKHMERLNEYEVGGNLNMDMNIGNQAYNSFRNQLDKKHFITYHNYQLEPADRKR